MIRRTMILLMLSAIYSLAEAQVVEQTASEPPPQQPPYRLMGKLHRPLGEVVKVQGQVVEGEFKGYEGGPNLVVHRINGKATQEQLQIRIRAYFHDFGHEQSKLPELKMGEEYEFEGYETGAFVGIPNEAYDRAGIGLQTTSFYFSHVLVVYKGKRIPPLVWSPADFVDRPAIITGRAVSADGKAYIVGKDWRLLVDADAPWPERDNGKDVEGSGVIRKSENPGLYVLENGKTWLLHLKDQLGRKVSLRGTAWSLNGHWWLEYQGTKLYVENMKELPGWNANLHGTPMVIDGVLDEAELPSLEQITLKPDRDLEKYYIVRQASWKPLESVRSVETNEE